MGHQQPAEEPPEVLVAGQTCQALWKEISPQAPALQAPSPSWQSLLISLWSEHLVTSEDLHHFLLGGHAHPDVGKGRSIVAQPDAHLYLDGLTGQLCRGGRGGSLWGPLIV